MTDFYAKSGPESIATSDRKTQSNPGVFIIKRRAEEITRRSLKISGGVIKVLDYDRLLGIIYRAMREAYRAGLKEGKP